MGNRQRSARPNRQALSNRGLLGITFSGFANTMNEWMMYITALIYAFGSGGASVAGYASIAILVAVVIAAPLAGLAAERGVPARLLLTANAVSCLALTLAAVLVAGEAPVAAVIACCAVAQAGITFTRPVSAVLTPGVVRSARELTVANVWENGCDNLAMIAGPVVATVALSIGQPTTSLAISAALAVIATAAIFHIARREPRRRERPHPTDDTSARTHMSLGATIRRLRGERGVRSILAVIGLAYVLVGALDLVFVVFAAENLNMDEAGPGALSSAVGAGALISSFVATRLVARKRLAPFITAGLAVIGIAVCVLASVSVVPVAAAILAAVGFCRALVVLFSRMLLQRSAPPGTLAPTFAVVELLIGVAMLCGSLLTQAVIAASGPEATLLTIGGLMLVSIAIIFRPLQHVDDAADVPVVAISLLRKLALFQPLPPLELEAVARAAEEIDTTAGEVIIREGDAGDHFYAVADGSFDVDMRGEVVEVLHRGAGFGEVALLAGVPRIATVKANRNGSLLRIGRGPFLEAVTGCDSSFDIAWTAIRGWNVDPPESEVSDS
jgi:predicted MFS family arabinose efflux permease